MASGILKTENVHIYYYLLVIIVNNIITRTILTVCHLF